MSIISTSGISPQSIIRSEHLLRIINALSNKVDSDILISGSLIITGSTNITGSLNVGGGITGSFSGDGSRLTGITGEWDGSYNGNASITGSLNVSGGITGSLNGTSSYALTSSYLESSGSIKVGNDSSTASLTNVGAIRYRTELSSSYVDMVMQTGTSTYEWVNIVQNIW